MDLYPTLAELAGLPKPSVPQPIDGESLVPVLKDPSVRVSDHVYHAFPRGGHLGRAIRTERYRLVEWTPEGKRNGKTDWELYDYEVDPLERHNLASAQPEIVTQLRRILDRYPEAVTRGRN